VVGSRGGYGCRKQSHSDETFVEVDKGCKSVGRGEGGDELDLEGCKNDQRGRRKGRPFGGLLKNDTQAKNRCGSKWLTGKAPQLKGYKALESFGEPMSQFSPALIEDKQARMGQGRGSREFQAKKIKSGDPTRVFP